MGSRCDPLGSWIARLVLRALLNVGRENVAIGSLTLLDSRLEIIGVSSGYLILDASGAEGEIRVGDELGFSLNCGALLATMTSKYVKKRPLVEGVPAVGE